MFKCDICHNTAQYRKDEKYRAYFRCKRCLDRWGGNDYRSIEKSTIKLNIYTGPCIVTQIAEAMREAGIKVTCEGTERVYIEIDALDSFDARETMREKLQKTHGKTFGL